MRVIAGEFRSRRLKSLPGNGIRPTPDRIRESLFNVLAPEIERATFVDAYAGTGSVGIEALSRGAKRVIFLENSKPALAAIRQNLDSLKALSRATTTPLEDIPDGRQQTSNIRRSRPHHECINCAGAQRLVSR